MFGTADLRRENFHQFLKTREVKAVGPVDRSTSRLAGLEHLFSTQTARQLSIHSIAANIENAQAFLISHHQRINNIYAPDTIYQYHRLPCVRSILNSGATIDRFHTLYHYDQDDSWSNEDELVNAELQRLKSLETEAYTIWEHHDPKLLNKIKSHKIELKPYTEENPAKNESTELSNNDFCSLVKVSPAHKFDDSLKLKFIASSEIDGIIDSRCYKNNLSSVITSHSGEKMLVVGELSQLYFYSFDPLTLMPHKSPLFCINIEPPITTPEQFRGLTWEFNPHTINFIKTISDWHGGELVIVCGDDGQIIMWNSDKMFKHRSLPNFKVFKNLEAKPDLRINVSASAWGVDLTSCNDSKDQSHDIAVVTYNSRKVELFYYSALEEEFVTLCTDLLPHNVPEASFLSYSETEGKHEAVVSLVSISNDIMTYLFSWVMDSKSGRPDVISIKMDIILNYRLEYENWTTKPIDAKYFRKVYSLEELNGDFSNEQSVTEARVLRESIALGSKECNKFTSSLGIAASWQSLCPPVVKFGNQSQVEEKEVSARKRDSQYNSIAQAYKRYETLTSTSMEKSLALKFLAISSRCEISLYRADTLLCCASASDVFAKTPDLPDEAYFSNRILLSLVIPELSCLVAATQLGLVVIMRLCQYRGIYSMRQEHIFPHFSAYISADGLGRPLIGLAANRMSVLGEKSRYYLYLVYSKGHVLTYQLLDSWNNWELLSI